MSNKKRLFLHAAILVFFIFGINTMANAFYWYYSIWWFDMPMHFLGGAFIGLLALWHFGFPKRDVEGNTAKRRREIRTALIAALVIGLLWEVFEYVVGRTTGINPNTLLDSTSDIFFDLAGAAAAALYFVVRRFNALESKL